MSLFAFRLPQKLILALVSVFIVTIGSQSALGKVKFSKFSTKEQRYLVNTLHKHGIDKSELRRIFADPWLKKMVTVVDRNVINLENKRDYSNFYTPYSIDLAYKFSRNWRTVLSKASRKFDVDPEVLVAILLVESGFGSQTGKYPVVSVFASIMVEDFWKQGVRSRSKGLSKLERHRLERLRKKAQWAEKELVALFQISRERNMDPLSIKGSYAGAFGLPQFLPSSYAKYGFDSDRNGTVNLYLFPDAIFSTANYLKSHGWKRGLHHKSNEKAVWAYNNSQHYVDTVLTVAKRVRKVAKQRAARRRLALN